jgi:hypothetical protein
VSDDKPANIALIVEADADARTARVLVDRRLRAAADWLRDANLDDFRAWQVIHWTDIKKMCADHGVVVQGRFEGGSAAPDARAARRALILLSKLGLTEVVILLRDADNQRSRRHGLEQGRADRRHEMPINRIAIGLADPTREAWHLVGFIPATAAESQTLAAERQRLSLDPTRQPQRLVRSGDRDIKVVLERLTCGDKGREYSCLAECPDEHLRERGRECGLSEFLDEIDNFVVKAFI